MRPSVALPFLLLVLALAACDAGPPATLDLQGRTMGTSYHVRLADPPAGFDRRAAAAAVDAELEAINASMSTWREDSTISRFNRAPAGEWVQVEPAFAEVLERSRAIHALTDGAFDPTVGPLVTLWGFGARPRTGGPPGEAAIRAAMRHVGMDKVETREDASGTAVRKTVPGVELDFSAIAKGYAVDRVFDRLRALGARDLLVEIGGEVRLAGSRGERPWRLAVERPGDAGRSVQQVIEPGAAGVATSGDYRNFLEHDGRRYTHVLDPREGRPVRRGVASATVIATTTARADALATACMVMGADDCLALAEREGLGVYLLEHRGAGLAVRRSTAFGDALPASDTPGT